MNPKKNNFNLSNVTLLNKKHCAVFTKLYRDLKFTLEIPGVSKLLLFSHDTKKNIILSPQ